MPISVSSRNVPEFSLIDDADLFFLYQSAPITMYHLFRYSSPSFLSGCFNLFLKRSRVTFLLLLEFSLCNTILFLCFAEIPLTRFYFFSHSSSSPLEISFGKSASCLSLTLNSLRADWIVSTTSQVKGKLLADRRLFPAIDPACTR